jgi:outer membrane protein TolC
MNARNLVLLLAVTLVAPPAHAAVLTLQDVLRDVAVANPSLQAKRAMADAAAERRRPAGAWEAPKLEVGVLNLPLSGRFDDDMMTMKMVGLSQRVPLSGANGLRRRAASEQSDADASASDRAQYEILGEAVELYASIYYHSLRLLEAERHIGTLGRLVAAAEARYRSATGRLDELLRAESERASVKLDAIRFRTDLDRARADLDALRGLSSDHWADSLESQAPPTALPLPASPSVWVDAVLLGHPRVEEAMARERGYRSASKAAGRAAWPDLELGASYGQRGRDRFGTDQDDMLSATVGLQLPLGFGSREGAMAAEFRAMERAAGAERREAELDLSRRVRTLHAEAEAASRTVSLLADSVVATQARAVEASWSAYAAGVADLWRVLEPSHMLYTSELLLLDAREQLARAQGRLVALTGRSDLAGVELPPLPNRRVGP